MTFIIFSNYLFFQLALVLPTQGNYLAAICNNNRLHVVDFMKVYLLFNSLADADVFKS